MASQPITTARRGPTHWLGFDQGALLLTIALVTRWEGYLLPAIVVGGAGILLMAYSTYRAVRRPESVEPAVTSEPDGVPASSH